jgi:hypothetical protein
MGAGENPSIHELPALLSTQLKAGVLLRST